MAEFDAEVAPGLLRIEGVGLDPGPYLRRHGALLTGHTESVEVCLRERVLEFRWSTASTEPHGDLLAALAIFAFFPSLDARGTSSGRLVRLGWSVSRRLALAVSHLPGGLRVEGRGECAPYDPTPHDVLSYGGGFDSLSAACLFPTALLIHEAPLTVLEGKLTSAVLSSRPGVEVVYTNQRSLYDVWGVGSWPAVLSAALLYSPSTLVTGINAFDTAYLRNGHGYRPYRDHPDEGWSRFLNTLGIRVLPISFLTELTSARLLHRWGLGDVAAYCERIPFIDCGQCAKCLRRRTLKVLVDPGRVDLLEFFDPGPETLAGLRARPLEWRHTYGLASVRGLLPKWMTPLVEDAVDALAEDDVAFQEFYFPPAFDHLKYTDDERSSIEGTLARHGIQPMSPSSMERARAYRYA